jgi:hypothetical protein
MFLMQNAGCPAVDGKGSDGQLTVVGMFSGRRREGRALEVGSSPVVGQAVGQGFGDCAGQSSLRGVFSVSHASSRSALVTQSSFPCIP